MYRRGHNWRFRPRLREMPWDCFAVERNRGQLRKAARPAYARAEQPGQSYQRPRPFTNLSTTRRRIAPSVAAMIASTMPLPR